LSAETGAVSRQVVPAPERSAAVPEGMIRVAGDCIEKPLSWDPYEALVTIGKEEGKMVEKVE